MKEIEFSCKECGKWVKAIDPHSLADCLAWKAEHGGYFEDGPVVAK